MNVLVVDNGSVHARKIGELFTDATVTYKTHDDPTLHVTDPSDIVVLSGGSTMPVYGSGAYYRNELELIKNHGGPIIGICLGFELIANAFKSQLLVRDERRLGTRTIIATASGFGIMLVNRAEVYEAHRWYVPDVPSPLVALATSESGVEMVMHESKPIYGMQFHPEVSDGNDGQRIFNGIIAHIERTRQA